MNRGLDAESRVATRTSNRVYVANDMLFLLLLLLLGSRWVRINVLFRS